jgi:hypothetical protein
MTKSIIARVWSRIPIFLKILLYGSAFVPAILASVWILMQIKDYRCGSARVTEAQAWTALANHFDEWETAHPGRELGRSPEGSLHIRVIGERIAGSMLTRSAYCRRAARYLRQDIAVPFGDPLADGDDEVGQHMWRDIVSKQGDTNSACYEVGGRGPLHNFH